MTKEKFYSLLGELDEETVHAAGEMPEARRRGSIMRFAGIAACVCLLAGAGFWYLHSRPDVPETSQPAAEDSAEGNAVEHKDVSIYYLEGGEIRSKTQYLPCLPKEIFPCWKEANGIGDEVELLNVKIESNGTESHDDSVAGYRTGDSFCLYVTVTKNLEDYCTGRQGELLLESLQKTMTGYSHISFDGYKLILE